MIAAHRPIQRPPQAKLMTLDARGAIGHGPRDRFVGLLRSGDLVIANDAATLPASLAGIHAATGRRIEVRLAQRRSLDPEDVHDFVAIVFGEGDFHTRTEDRPLPPALELGDVLQLGPLHAVITRVLGHPRLVRLHLEGTSERIWAGLASHGRPIQYAHVAESLALWDVWTPLAGTPAAFEPPSAGFVLDWKSLAALRARHVAFASLTHAAGISSTGDAALDRILPLDEPYRIPEATALAIAQAKRRKGRIIAVGTTVVRALEAAASSDGQVRAGEGIATQRIGPSTRLRVVDAILSGTHEAGSSHHELLRAFADEGALLRADAALEFHGYRTHEFGDSVLVEAAKRV
jgi:S-adenosylmethionine:tRNA ribosyltransferase-isomerase